MSSDEEEFEGGTERSDYIWKQCNELDKQVHILRRKLAKCKESGDVAGHQPAIGRLTASVRALHSEVEMFYASAADAPFIAALKIAPGSYEQAKKEAEETIKTALELGALK